MELLDGKIDIALQMFTDTINDLKSANEELTEMGTKCKDKINYYTGVHSNVNERITSNNKTIEKIKSIID